MAAAWRNRLKGVGFVLITLLFWLVFAVLAQAVVTAVQAMPQCVKTSGIVSCLLLLGGPNDVTPTPRVNWVVLIVTLLGALWAASRLVFPPEDFDTPPKQAPAARG